MKKIFLTFMLIFSVSALYTQNKIALTKNDFQFSVGDGIFHMITANKSNLFAQPSLSFNYFYSIQKWFWLGGTLNFCHISSYGGNRGPDYVDSEKTKEKYSPTNFFGLAPTVRFSYINRPNFILYSGTTLGVGCYFQSSKKQFVPFIQETFIGFSSGKKFYFGAELGAGFRGILNGNIGYRF